MLTVFFFFAMVTTFPSATNFKLIQKMQQLFVFLWKRDRIFIVFFKPKSHLHVLVTEVSLAINQVTEPLYVKQKEFVFWIRESMFEL